MKTVSSALGAHLARPATTLAICWKVVRTDGRVYGFTDHDEDVAFNDGAGPLVYRAATGQSGRSLEKKSDLSVDNSEVLSLFGSGVVTEADLRAGLWGHAEIYVHLVNWAAPSQGSVKLARGRIGDVRINELSFAGEFRGMTQAFHAVFGHVWQHLCRADLGHGGCANSTAGDGVSLAAIRDISQVASVVGSARDTFVVPGSTLIKHVLKFSTQIAFYERTRQTGPASIEIGVFSPIRDGTPRNPFIVSTPSGLDAMRNDDQAWYALETDIDMSGWGLWTPIADFRGGLDGRGHKIRNLDLDHSASSREAGLFTNLWTGAHVRRLGLENFVVRAGSSAFYCGALAARRTGGVNGLWGTVEDIWTAGGSVTTDGDRAGGLIGLIDAGAVLRRCIAANSINGAVGTRVGGLLGFADAAAAQSELYFDSSAAGTAETGSGDDSVARSTSAMMASATFSGFDLDFVWQLASGAYPTLRQWHG